MLAWTKEKTESDEEEDDKKKKKTKKSIGENEWKKKNKHGNEEKTGVEMKMKKLKNDSKKIMSERKGYFKKKTPTVIILRRKMQ